MPSEYLFFNEGLAYNARSSLQSPGFLKTCVNIDFIKDGEQRLRTKFSNINTTAINAIHSTKRFRNRLLVGDSTYLRHNGLSGNFTSLGSTFSNNIFTFKEYKDFLHFCNGVDNLLFDASGNLYNAYVANPTTAPTGADSGVAGNPSDTYTLYVSYLITWPNGQQYETGISDGSDDVTVASKKITWTAIPVCPYEAVSGTNPTIYRKLYRGPGTGGTLADIYHVTTITDNTTTTYTDNETDAAIAANGACAVEDYDVPPTTPRFLEYHYSRLFMIDTENPHRLYYSEPPQGDTSTENEVLRPLAFVDNNWDDIRSVGINGRVQPQGLIAWGTYLYIPLKQTWIRKYGNDPDTWSYKKTWARHGIAAPYTVGISTRPDGIIGLTAPKGKTPGLAIFNGLMSQMITDKRFYDLFEDDMNRDAIDKCRGGISGRYYHLLYPSGSNTEPDKHAVFDLDGFPKTRLAYWEDLAPRSIDVQEDGDGIYLGSSDGYVRQNSGSETVNIEVETHDRIGGDPKLSTREKTFKFLKFAINTGGVDVTIRIYIDDELMRWPDNTTEKTISGTGESIQKQPLPKNAKGYRYSINLSASSLTTLNLYGPWEMEFEFNNE